eukprot:scaffold3_cov389-Prasinococcus_capsulatus_cf.AAC.19
MLDREAIEAGGVRKAKTTPEFAALLCQVRETASLASSDTRLTAMPHGPVRRRSEQRSPAP